YCRAGEPPRLSRPRSLISAGPVAASDVGDGDAGLGSRKLVLSHVVDIDVRVRLLPVGSEVSPVFVAVEPESTGSTLFLEFVGHAIADFCTAPLEVATRDSAGVLLEDANRLLQMVHLCISP